MLPGITVADFLSNIAKIKYSSTTTKILYKIDHTMELNFKGYFQYKKIPPKADSI